MKKVTRHFENQLGINNLQEITKGHHVLTNSLMFGLKTIGNFMLLDDLVLSPLIYERSSLARMTNSVYTRAMGRPLLERNENSLTYSMIRTLRSYDQMIPSLPLRRSEPMMDMMMRNRGVLREGYSAVPEQGFQDMGVELRSFLTARRIPIPDEQQRNFLSRYMPPLLGRHLYGETSLLSDLRNGESTLFRAHTVTRNSLFRNVAIPSADFPDPYDPLFRNIIIPNHRRTLDPLETIGRMSLQNFDPLSINTQSLITYPRGMLQEQLIMESQYYNRITSNLNHEIYRLDRLSSQGHFQHERVSERLREITEGVSVRQITGEGSEMENLASIYLSLVLMSGMSALLPTGV